MPIQQVKTIQEQKRLLNLSGSVPTGNPVGTLLTTYKKIQPRNYLYCDGRDTTGTEEELRTHYPALYMYLGSNVLPDYRECVMVGAEQNTTDTIATHDVYAQGEFKDDQMQNITLRMRTTAGGEGNSIAMTGASAIYDRTINDVSISGRFGTTTHGKQKAVYVYIKAVDGVDISDEDSFLTVVENYIDEKNSYSTTEKMVGYWLDGKPRYRKTLVFPNGTGTTSSKNYTLSDYGINNVDEIFVMPPSFYTDGTRSFPFSFYDGNRYSVEVSKTTLSVLLQYSSIANSKFVVTLEYTKTTT